MIHQWERFPSGDYCETWAAISNLTLWVYWCEPEPHAALFSPFGSFVGRASDILGYEPMEIEVDGSFLGDPETANLGELGSIPKAVYVAVA